MTRFALRENLAIALDTVRSRKIRSGLTILGVVIGVMSVISVAAIIDGLNGFIKQRIQTFGSRAFFVMRIPPGYTGIGPLPQKIRMRKYLEMSDARYLKDSVAGLDVATAFANRINFGTAPPDSMTYGNEHVERMIVRGTQPDYVTAIPLFSVDYGRFISEFDEDHARDVVVIGHAIADSLFPHSDPIGKWVKLDGRRYEVIGVFEKDPGLFGGGGVDIFACIPMSNFHKNFPEVKEVFLLFSARQDANLDTVRDQVTELMRRRRHVRPNAESDFEIADPNFFIGLWDQLTGAMALLTGIISSIGLLVGGIGVMNIMLISVTERTAEIGIRKAIGARKADIRAQFLMEAVTLSGIGGVLGILGGGVVALLARLANIPATVSPFWVVAGVTMSAGVGLFFGYYPANRAANLDPIVCLRYE